MANNTEELLKILVEKAEKKQTITYGDVGNLLGVPAHGGVQPILENVRDMLQPLDPNKFAQNGVQLIRSLVVYAGGANRGLCGGADDFVRRSEDIDISQTDFNALTPQERRNRVARVHDKVFVYAQWNDVLRELGL